MLAYKLLDAADLDSRQTSTAVKTNRVKPKLSDAIVALPVDVRWLVAIARVEEEPIRSDS
jgi:hypothetical protein